MAAAYADSPFPLILKRSQASADDPVERPGDPAHASLASGGESLSRISEAGPTISLLGPLTFSGTRKHLRGLRGPTKELLAYLAFHPAGAHRDQIIDALWPDQPPDQGRNRLWRAASDARSHFGEAIINRDGDHYRLNRTELTIDLDRLDQAASELEYANRPEELRTILERALALFKGEPLAGSDFPWAENEQRRLHALHLDLLERAGLVRLELGDPSGALADAETGLALEPYNEQLARVAMQAEAALGLRGAVIQRYEGLSQRLEDQLGLQPRRETRQLYRELLGQDSPGNRSESVPVRSRVKQ
jgi:DNA-binding SARP family transcriptional activator